MNLRKSDPDVVVNERPINVAAVYITTDDKGGLMVKGGPRTMHFGSMADALQYSKLLASALRANR